MYHASNKFCGNPISSICVILFTNKQTNKQMDEGENITSLQFQWFGVADGLSEQSERSQIQMRTHTHYALS